MREFQEKHQFRKRLYSKTMLVVLFIVIILIARGVINVYAKEKASRDELVRVEKEKSVIQERFSSLQNNSDKLKTQEGIEAEIRGKFDVAKSGEGVIVIVDREAPTPIQEKKSVLHKIWDSVFGIFKKKDQ